MVSIPYSFRVHHDLVLLYLPVCYCSIEGLVDAWSYKHARSSLCLACLSLDSIYLQHELTGLSRPDADHTDNETDEMTSMLQSNFDVSVSMAGDVPPYTGGQVVDDGRYSSVNRGRPVIIATNPHREGKLLFRRMSQEEIPMRSYPTVSKY